VGQYDITTTARALSALSLQSGDLPGNTFNVPGITVYCSAIDATAATVVVAATTMTLTIIGGTTAGTRTITLTDYFSLAQLTTAINILSGWSATTTGNVLELPTSLVSLVATNCLGASNALVLQVQNNLLLGMLIEQATNMIEKALGTHVLLRSYREFHYGGGSHYLYPSNIPIRSVDRVGDDRVMGIAAAYWGPGTRAVVQVLEDRVRLKSTLAGVDTTTDLLFVNYACVRDIYNAIIAVPGWGQSVLAADGTGYPDYASSDLIPCASRLAQQRVAYMYVPFDCYDEVEVTNDLQRVFSPWGWRRSRMAWIPDQQTTPGLPTEGLPNITLYYTAGWAIVPPAIESACFELLTIMFNMVGRNPLLTDESLGDYSSTLKGGADLFTAHKQEELQATAGMLAGKLSMYRRITSLIA
jgi:hypothetical protein